MIVLEQVMLSEWQQEESQIFRFWDSLNASQRTSFSQQLSLIQPQRLAKQKLLIQERQKESDESFEPLDDLKFSGHVQCKQLGQKGIEQGKLGCLVLAGGQGTRLKCKGPKGTYPISLIKNKSLFQLCAEKVKAASHKAGRLLDLAIMTSDENDKETRAFFLQNHFFGLDSSQISFFVQENLPFLDIQGNMFLQKPGEIAVGPNGNGEGLLCFGKSGILNHWIQKGIEYVHVILIDNPLADPFDAELLGFHCEQEAEITVKCTEKVNPEENVGLLVKQNGRYKVVEYTEMSKNEKMARRVNGKLKHCYANLSLFCFSLSFIQRMCSEGFTLPLHKAWKACTYVDNNGISLLSDKPIAWKFETYIFDWLACTPKVAALMYPREQCFAPLKNAAGLDSPETVRAALQHADRQVIQKITGLTPPEFPFELSAEFYYPTPELLMKWKGRQIVDSFVEQ